jgi:predicted nucleotidyltransferase
MKNQKQIRLSENYIKTIKLLAEKYFGSDDVRIFGSRTDMKKKGGDIDIYIYTNKNIAILKSKIAFLAEFEMILGEQKVDLVVQSGNKYKKIFEIARNEGIRI